jgi:hypothetical protein
LTDVSLLGASQSAFFFGVPKFGNLAGFFSGNVKTHTKIVIFRDLLPLFEIKIIKLASSMATVNQHSQAHHQLDACYYSVWMNLN